MFDFLGVEANVGHARERGTAAVSSERAACQSLLISLVALPCTGLPQFPWTAYASSLMNLWTVLLTGSLAAG